MMSMFDMFKDSLDSYSELLSDLVDLKSKDEPNNKYEESLFVDAEYEVKDDSKIHSIEGDI